VEVIRVEVAGNAEFGGGDDAGGKSPRQWWRIGWVWTRRKQRRRRGRVGTVVVAQRVGWARGGSDEQSAGEDSGGNTQRSGACVSQDGAFVRSDARV